MKVFISWSGELSKTVAEGLRHFLPEVIQALDPWVSESDIKAGERWLVEVGQELAETKFGIICLTKRNQHRPWMLFEAGALAKTIENTFVVPYLIDMEPGDINGPLFQFQAKRWTKVGTFELIETINSAMEQGGLGKDSLRRSFNRSWPDFEKSLEELPEEEDQEKEIVLEESANKESVANSTRELASRLNTWVYDFEINDPFKKRTYIGNAPNKRNTAQIQASMLYDKHIDELIKQYRENFLLEVVEIKGTLEDYGVTNDKLENNYQNPRNYSQVRALVEGFAEVAGKLERGVKTSDSER